MALAQIGVCYYPEHWPETAWQEHAASMVEAGISRVRIAEFAWSRLEVARDEFRWEWLDRAIDVLHGAGLGIVLCTPTACPPHWLVRELPDILPVDSSGHPRGFGSRRHYRFSSESYRREARRISQHVVDRYSHHPGIVGWQTDNEYGCHDTTCSYAAGDLECFQAWLRRRYGAVEALNEDWGCVFWSQEYTDFSDIGLPNLTVTEANPAHCMAFRRFASEQVACFNRDQVDIIRASKGADRWITHNFMGNYSGFDHFALGQDLDVATWDSYPLGFLDQGWASDEEKLRYRRIGHPDWAAFHHDLYHSVGGGRFGVMEQQPGPVNWAPSNAEPLASAPAFWAMEAIAHGAELVSFFRFQQNPRAQEQLHAALRLPDGTPAPAWDSVKSLQDLLAALPDAERGASEVALLFDYESCWATEIQPHADHMDALEHALDCYSAARSLGIDVDIVGPHTALGDYKLLLIPGSVFVDAPLVETIRANRTKVLALPRSGSRDRSFALPEGLPPGSLQALLPLRVIAIDSMREGAVHRLQHEGTDWEVRYWRERVETDLVPVARCEDGTGIWYHHEGHHYLAARLEAGFMRRVLDTICIELGIESHPLPEGLRRRRRGQLEFVFNFHPEARDWQVDNAELLLGRHVLATGDFAVWQISNQDGDQ